MGDIAGISYNGVYPVNDEHAKVAHVSSLEQYGAMHKRSLEDPENFWGELARENLDWFRDFDQTVVGTVAKGDVAWFLNGQLNVSVNCIDRHVKKNPNKTAIIWEADEIGEGRNISYIVYGPLANGVTTELVMEVRAKIGAFASPDIIVMVPELPKTRSGKIVRRVLRKISHGEEDSLGDMSTLAEPEVVPVLISAMRSALVGKSL
ncbi:Acetyl-coenzyme A synthetase 2-like, mitochondrial [Phytophthora boehmeriae]|uniref:Acetyl-coenzyme A synthetase 2-like, mitochondrial n=1 Tax=Phytophthora boehmeriae TaxID=109152 RepID=A0A8T1XCS6_9STRA|nr:Acetyl-coenzyme A synthetase 2-like, mitochondrial [Phytophthora boehmeriae]